MYYPKVWRPLYPWAHADDKQSSAPDNQFVDGRKRSTKVGAWLRMPADQSYTSRRLVVREFLRRGNDKEKK